MSWSNISWKSKKHSWCIWFCKHSGSTNIMLCFGHAVDLKIPAVEWDNNRPQPLQTKIKQIVHHCMCNFLGKTHPSRYDPNTNDMWGRGPARTDFRAARVSDAWLMVPRHSSAMTCSQEHEDIYQTGLKYWWDTIVQTVAAIKVCKTMIGHEHGLSYLSVNLHHAVYEKALIEKLEGLDISMLSHELVFVDVQFTWCRRCGWTAMCVFSHMLAFQALCPENLWTAKTWWHAPAFSIHFRHQAIMMLPKC